MNKLLFSAALFAAFIVGTGVHAADKRVMIVNDSSHSIIRVQATNINDTSYGEALNSSTIAPGESEIIDLDDGAATCQYDIMATMRGGYEAHRTINACRVETWTITD